MFKQKVLLAVAVLSLTGIAVQAAPWFSHNSRRTPKTLSVVGNYKTPRLMAETILSLTRQPYLLIASDGRYFIVMSKDVQEVPKSKLDVYINNLNPQRLVILGDERYVSRTEEMNLRRINLRRIPIVRIYGKVEIVEFTIAGDEMCGDLDGDGEITVADALHALRIAARLIEATERDLRLGDTDGDGSITVADALAILRVAAKLTASL